MILLYLRLIPNMLPKQCRNILSTNQDYQLEIYTRDKEGVVVKANGTVTLGIMGTVLIISTESLAMSIG